MLNNKNRAFTLVAALLMPALLWADDDIGLSKLADLSFGTIDYEGTTGSGNVTMGSNGNVAYGNNTSGSGLGTPGQLQITGPEGTTVTIACSTAGSLALPGTGTLAVTPVHFSIGSANTGSPAGDTNCTGPSTSVATHTITATASENTLFIGGTLATNGQPLGNGTFSSTSGGSLPAFVILVQ